MKNEGLITYPNPAKSKRKNVLEKSTQLKCENLKLIQKVQFKKSCVKTKWDLLVPNSEDNLTVTVNMEIKSKAGSPSALNITLTYVHESVTERK